MPHFVYKTESPDGYFYIGKHSTENVNDGYVGSGNWVKSVDRSLLNRTILEFCETADVLVERETYHIQTNFFNPKCMNLIGQSTGWVKGRLRGDTWNRGKSWSSDVIAKNRQSNLKTRELMTQEQKDLVAHSISLANKGNKKPAGFGEGVRQRLAGVPKSISHRSNIGLSSKNTKFINNSIINTKVKVEQLPGYLSNGWNLGMVKR